MRKRSRSCAGAERERRSEPCGRASLLRHTVIRMVEVAKLGESEHPALTGLEKVHRLPEGFLELESMIIEACK